MAWYRAPRGGRADLSGDSLSTFESEQGLTSEQAAPRVPVVAPSNASGPPLLVLALVALVIGQASFIAWLWSSGRAWPQPVVTTASLTVTSDPVGTAVLVDSELRGATPLTMLLEAGDHQVQVGAGSLGSTQALTLRPGSESNIHVVQATPVIESLEQGTLEITTEPPGLPVSVNGEARGPSPISVTDLEPGTHEVSVTRGSSVVRRSVSVEAGVPTAVLITTSATTGISSGWLTVTAPVPVQIHEGGTLVGNSETPRLLLPVGRHDLEFFNDAFGYRVRQAVQITAGQAAAVALAPVNGSLSVNAQPWGEVWVDGQRVGETPIGNLQLPIGNHEVVVRHPQLGERRRTVAVTGIAPARVGIDLRP